MIKTKINVLFAFHLNNIANHVDFNCISVSRVNIDKSRSH